MTSTGPCKCFVTQWGGVSNFLEKSVTKVYSSMLLGLRGGGWVPNLQKKRCVRLEWPLKPSQYLKKIENTHTGTGRVSGPARYHRDSVWRAVLSPVAPDCWRCGVAGSYRRTCHARTCYVRSAWCSQSRRPRPATRPRLGIACWSCTPDLQIINRSKNIFHIIHNSIQVIHPNAHT